MKNQRTHRDKTRQWQIGKSAIECVLVILAAVFLPMILVVYGSMWATRKIEKPGFRIAASFTVGTILTLTMGWALELLVLMGVFSVDMLSDDFLAYMNQRKQQREQSQVA